MPRLSGSRLTGLLVAALVAVILTGTSLAAWIGGRDAGTPVAAGVHDSGRTVKDPGREASRSVRPSGSPAPARRAASSAAPALPSRTAPTDSARPAPAPPTPSGSSMARPAAPAAPVPGSSPTDGTESTDFGPSTNLTVSMSAAAAGDPRSQQLQAAFQHYFDAINQHDFAAWSEAVPLAQARRQDRGDWTRSYSTTTDSSITIEAIRADTVDVRFISEQDVAFAPADLPVTCIRWTVSYAVSKRADRWVVGAPGGGVRSRTSCA